MARKIAKAGLDLIKHFEGCQLLAYKPVPTEKFYTIGWGHYGEDVKKGQRITQAEADAMLVKDLAKYESYVNNKAYVPLTDQLNQNQFDALVSFCYNCGQGNLKSLCENRTLSQIAASIPKYNKSSGTVLKGLVRRRQAEVDLFNTKVTSTSKSPDEVTALVNGKKIEGAVLVNGTVLIPLRAAGDNIKGATIDWNKETLTAKLDTP